MTKQQWPKGYQGLGTYVDDEGACSIIVFDESAIVPDAGSVLAYHFSKSFDDFAFGWYTECGVQNWQKISDVTTKEGAEAAYAKWKESNDESRE